MARFKSGRYVRQLIEWAKCPKYNFCRTDLFRALRGSTIGYSGPYMSKRLGISNEF
jgi:hypothetical protein